MDRSCAEVSGKTVTSVVDFALLHCCNSEFRRSRTKFNGLLLKPRPTAVLEKWLLDGASDSARAHVAEDPADSASEKVPERATRTDPSEVRLFSFDV